MSQEGFSNLVGMDRTYVGLLERGKSNPTLQTVWTLAQGLGVPANEVVRRIEVELEKERQEPAGTGPTSGRKRPQIKLRKARQSQR